MSNNIKVFVTDVDGCLTDGCIIFTDQGDGICRFHAHDGLGLSVLKKMGITLIAISGRKCKAVEHRLNQLGFHHIILGSTNKQTDLRNLLNELSLSFKDIAYVGDDLIDLEVMELAAKRYAPANAVDIVKKISCFTSAHKGGDGAVRDIIEHMLAKDFKTSVMCEYFKEGTQSIVQ
tara:strand:+ start:15785 stop:16312 length:528 start_codon:yes stop_codon:yes gene_type:complete